MHLTKSVRSYPHLPYLISDCTVALFYLQFVNGAIIGKTLLLVAGLFALDILLAGACRLEIVRLRPMEKIQMQAGNIKRSSPEKDNKKAKDVLCMKSLL